MGYVLFAAYRITWLDGAVFAAAAVEVALVVCSICVIVSRLRQIEKCSRKVTTRSEQSTPNTNSGGPDTIEIAAPGLDRNSPEIFQCEPVEKYVVEYSQHGGQDSRVSRPHGGSTVDVLGHSVDPREYERKPLSYLYEQSCVFSGDTPNTNMAAVVMGTPLASYSEQSMPLTSFMLSRNSRRFAPLKVSVVDDVSTTSTDSGLCTDIPSNIPAPRERKHDITQAKIRSFHRAEHKIMSCTKPPSRRSQRPENIDPGSPRPGGGSRSDNLTEVSRTKRSSDRRLPGKRERGSTGRGVKSGRFKKEHAAGHVAPPLHRGVGQEVTAPTLVNISLDVGDDEELFI